MLNVINITNGYSYLVDFTTFCVLFFRFNFKEEFFIICAVSYKPNYKFFTNFEIRKSCSTNLLSRKVNMETVFNHKFDFELHNHISKFLVFNCLVFKFLFLTFGLDCKCRHLSFQHFVFFLKNFQFFLSFIVFDLHIRDLISVF